MIREQLWAYLLSLFLISGGVLVGLIGVEGVKVLFAQGYITIGISAAMTAGLLSLSIILLGAKVMYAAWKGYI